MEKKVNIQPLFLTSGCITAEGMKLFLEKQLSTENNDLISTHLASCEFCADALEGFRIFYAQKPSENISDLINEIKADIETVALEKKSKIVSKPHLNKIRSYIAVAASLILLAGSYFVFWYNRPENSKKIASLNSTEQSMPMVKGKSLNTTKPVDEVGLFSKSKEISTSKKRLIASNETNNEITDVFKDIRVVTEDLQEPIVVKEEAKKNEQIDTNLSEKDNVVAGTTVTENMEVINKPEVVTISKSKMPESKRSNSDKSAYKTPVYSIVEEIPSFPGGEDSLQRFILKHLNYPMKAKKKKLQGTVIVNCTIDNLGKITDVSITKSLGSGCDEEAIRLIKLMPLWKPGKQSGIAVNTRISIPVKFTLNR